jgi:preprotein translocase subunit SecY
LATGEGSHFILEALLAQVRRVRRIIRKIDSWTVFKVSAIFWAVVGLALTLGFVMFWSVIQASGIPDKLVETLVGIGLLDQGTNPFGDSERFLRIAIFGSITVSVIAIGLTTLASVMYNLISDVVGGVEIVMLEETLTTPAATPKPYQTPRSRPAPNGSSTADLPTEETPVTTIKR